MARLSGGLLLWVVLSCVGVLGQQELRRAESLAEWFNSLTLLIPQDYEDKISGVELTVKDLECEKLAVGSIEARYLPPRRLSLTLDQLEASCDGDYKYKYSIFGASISGDGKVDVKVHRSTVELEIDFSVDALGAPLELTLTNCKTTLKVKDVDLRGDPVGDVANLFVDDFTDFFIGDVEKLICDELQPVVYSDLTSLVRDAGLEACAEDGVGKPPENFKIPERPEWVSWTDFVDVTKGPGARLVKSVNKDRKNSDLDGGDAFAALFDALDTFDAPLASSEPFVFKGPFSVVEPEELDLPYRELPLLTDVGLTLSAVEVTTTPALSKVKNSEMEANVDTLGGAQLGVDFKLPESALFELAANLTVGLSIGNLGENFEQDLLSPRLEYTARLGVGLRALQARVTATLALVAPRTKERVASFLLGDAVNYNCLLSVLAMDEVSADSLSLDYQRTPFTVDEQYFHAPPASQKFFDLERDLASSVLPAVVALVDSAFLEFTECGIRDVLNKTAREEATKMAREALGTFATAPEEAGVLLEKCEKRLDWRQKWVDNNDGQQGSIIIAWNESKIARSAANTLNGIDGTGLMRAAAVYLEDGKDIITLFDESQVRIPSIGTKLIVTDVQISQLDASIDNVTFLPGGSDALSYRSANVVSLRSGYEQPLTVSGKFKIQSPVGTVRIAVNVTAERVRVDSMEVAGWLDEIALDALTGKELGLSTIFDRKGSLDGLWCLPASLEALSLPVPPKIHIGSLGISAVSDAANVGAVVEKAAGALIVAFKKYVDREAIVSEALWLANDRAYDFLTDVHERCAEGAPVARNRDERGSRPTRDALNDLSEIDGSYEFTLEFLSVVGLLAVIFFSCSLLSRRKQARGAVRKIWKTSSKKQQPDTIAETWLEGNDEDKTASSLFWAAPVPLPFKCLLLLVMIGNFGLLFSSNVVVAAEVRIRLQFDLDDVGDREISVPTDAKFSLAESVITLWQSGSYLLALLIILLSGAWPYIELSVLLWGFLTPNLSPARRENAWRIVEMLSKWSFIDVFVVVFLVVAFHVRLKISTPEASFRADIFVEPRYGFYAFCGATLNSMCMGQILLNLHRITHKQAAVMDSSTDEEDEAKESQGGGAPAPDFEEEQILPASSSVMQLDREYSHASFFDLRCSLMFHRYKGLEARWWQKTIGPLTLGVGCLISYAYAVKCVEFEIGGAAGLAIDMTGDESDQRYTAAGIALALPSSTPDDGWRPLVLALSYVTIIFALVMPLLNVFFLAVLWIVPLQAPTQVRLLALSEVAFGWSSLDVYLVSIIATATQLTEIVRNFAKDECDSVDGFLRAFFDSALGGDTTCLRIAVEVRQGCIILTLACGAHLLLGLMAASVTTAAVAERAAQHAGALLNAPSSSSTKNIRAHDDDDDDDDLAMIELAEKRPDGEADSGADLPACYNL